MIQQYTATQLKEAMRGLTILVDSREKVNAHITAWLDGKGIPFKERGLDCGDYSVALGDFSFEDEIVIERKANLDEIAGNFTANRERFEREFLRAKANGVKVFLIVENASWADIALHNYRSQLKPQSLRGSLLSWQSRFNVTVNFCKTQETGQIIYETLYYWVRNRLKRG